MPFGRNLSELAAIDRSTGVKTISNSLL